MGLALTLLDSCNLAAATLLPQTPADRVLVDVGLRRTTLGRARDGFVVVEGLAVGEGEVSGADEPLGTPTAAYETLGLRAGLTVPAGRTKLDVALAVRNALDREYRDFLWSYKPFAPNPGRDVRLTAAWRF